MNKGWLLCLIALLITGCSPLQITDPFYLNQGLNYLPNNLGLTDKPHKTKLDLYPGMVLRITSIDADRKTKNNLQPGIASFDWVIPGSFTFEKGYVDRNLKTIVEHYSREDMLIIRYLTMSAIDISDLGIWKDENVKPKVTDCVKEEILKKNSVDSDNSNSRSLDRVLDRQICDAASKADAEHPVKDNSFNEYLERDKYFDKLVRGKVVTPFLRNLAINYVSSSSSDGKIDRSLEENIINAPAARRLMCQGSFGQFSSGSNTSNEAYLEFSLPDDYFGGKEEDPRRFAIYGRDGWYLSNSFSKDGNYDGNDLKRLVEDSDHNEHLGAYSDWLPKDSDSEKNSGPAARRSVFSVFTNLIIENGPSLPLAPICMSIEDVESQLTLPGEKSPPKILGFLRQPMYVDLKGLKSTDDFDEKMKRSTRPDGSIEFTFESSYSFQSNNSVILLDKANDSKATKANLLIAPNDIYILDRPLTRVPDRFY